MSRTADYTIQGFIYQFIITLHKLLQSTEDTEVFVEGIVEDIDIITPTGQEAVQCKYHESKSKFVLSAIYKPVLQMLCHYKKNPKANIKYRLHAHFPSETVGSKRSLTKTELQSILASKATDLQVFIQEINGFTGTHKFLKVFEIEFGASLHDAEKTAIVCLSSEGFSTEDAKEIFYPNAIHRIAELSIIHDGNSRKIKKSSFLAALKEKKKTAISRWTKELELYEQFLKKRKRQLNEVLNDNTRVRALILDSSYINDFENKVPVFIQDYVAKYNSKIKLNQCPVFSLIGDEELLNKAWRVLNVKKLTVQRGIVAGAFDVKSFWKDPVKSIKEGAIEFKLRLCNHNNEFEHVLNEGNIDDLIIVSDKDFAFVNASINIEKLRTPEINEIKYLLSLTNTL
jgi:hypothetical protein